MSTSAYPVILIQHVASGDGVCCVKRGVRPLVYEALDGSSHATLLPATPTTSAPLWEVTSHGITERSSSAPTSPTSPTPQRCHPLPWNATFTNFALKRIPLALWGDDLRQYALHISVDSRPLWRSSCGHTWPRGVNRVAVVEVPTELHVVSSGLTGLYRLCEDPGRRCEGLPLWASPVRTPQGETGQLLLEGGGGGGGGDEVREVRCFHSRWAVVETKRPAVNDSRSANTAPQVLLHSPRLVRNEAKGRKGGDLTWPNKDTTLCNGQWHNDNVATPIRIFAVQFPKEPKIHFDSWVSPHVAINVSRSEGKCGRKGKDGVKETTALIKLSGRELSYAPFTPNAPQKTTRRHIPQPRGAEFRRHRVSSARTHPGSVAVEISKSLLTAKPPPQRPFSPLRITQKARQTGLPELEWGVQHTKPIPATTPLQRFEGTIPTHSRAASAKVVKQSFTHTECVLAWKETLRRQELLERKMEEAGREAITPPPPVVVAPTLGQAEEMSVRSKIDRHAQQMAALQEALLCKGGEAPKEKGATQSTAKCTTAPCTSDARMEASNGFPALTDRLPYTAVDRIPISQCHVTLRPRFFAEESGVY